MEDGLRFRPELWHGRDVLDNCYDYAVGGPAHGRDDSAFTVPGQTQLIADYDRLIKVMDDNIARELNEADGLVFAGSGPELPPARDGHYLVAMYLAPAELDMQQGMSYREVRLSQFVSNYAQANPSDSADVPAELIQEVNQALDMVTNVDYHYVRQDADGSWSQKLGASAPSIFQEDAGAVPSKVTMSETLYERTYVLSGYYYVPEGGIDVGLDAHFERRLEGDSALQLSLKSLKDEQRQFIDPLHTDSIHEAYERLSIYDQTRLMQDVDGLDEALATGSGLGTLHAPQIELQR